MFGRLTDRLLLAQIAITERIRSWRDGLAEAARDERGQTPTEYLMIVGLMAVVIVIVFVTFYWQQVKQAASTWVANVTQSVTGKSVTP